MKETLEKFSLRLVEWVGSVSSLIVHTVVFLSIFGLRLFGMAFTDVLLVLTTLLSLEAIYLAILVQMTLNRHTRSLQDVRSDVEELQTEVEELIEDSE